MQKRDNYLRVRPGRNAWTLFRRGLVTEQEADEGARIPAHIKIGHDVAQRYADRIGGAAAGSLSEGLLGMPATAHILGGVPMGRSAAEGVVDAGGQVHNYPGLYVVDGSIVPANPGINPSLTITALAEYMMNQIEPKT
jgi:cholesterol oxidase